MKRGQGNRVEERAASGDRRGRLGRIGAAAIVAASACALLASTAPAAIVSVGSVLPPGSASKPFGSVQTLFNTALPEKGANLVSPVNGAIVRWRVQGAKGGPFSLRVLHPNGTGAYTAAGTSGPVTPSDTGLQTFTTNLPIHSGDLIGINPSNAGDEIGISEVPGASYAFIFPPPFDGSTVPPSGNVSGQEIQLSAEVQAAPAITSIVPNSGPIAGGTKVTITGSSFTTASAVKFGSTPASAFTVDSDTQITATVPPTKSPGRVNVNVTTLAGTNASVSGNFFTYRACVVPKLKGKKLKVAKNRLRNAGCKLGKVKKLEGVTAKTGKVAQQSPKAGKVLAPGTRVKVTLKK